jgi:hypothetical protein
MCFSFLSINTFENKLVHFIEKKNKISIFKNLFKLDGILLTRIEVLITNKNII